MAATTQTVEQVSLKLMVVNIDNKTEKVLYAEAGKDFMDVLCSFLTLPLGTIARLIEKKSDIGPVTLGCLNSFYHSVANLDKECLRTETCKETLLQPTNSSEFYCSALKLNIDDKPTKYFICSGSHIPWWYQYRCFRTSNQKCQCGSPINRVVFKKSLNKSFVKDGVSFFITDDLIVMPNSLQLTSFGLLQKYGIKSIVSIKEMNVNVTKEKVLDLLKCALFSKSPLTDWFLRKKPSLKRSMIFSCDIKSNSNIEFSLKLVIRKSAGKILFAEGEQDFADFLLSFLAFPLGGVVRILGGNCSLGSIDELYKSIAGFDENKYLTSIEAKTRLVNPHSVTQFKLIKQILPVQQQVSYAAISVYESCTRGITYDEFFVSDGIIAGTNKFEAVRLVGNPVSTKGSEGYVKGPAMYVVTDDLVIAPSSPISTLSLISQIPLDDLMEKVVTIGVKECLNILKAFLTSTSVLTVGLSHLLTEVKEEKPKSRRRRNENL